MHIFITENEILILVAMFLTLDEWHKVSSRRSKFDSENTATKSAPFMVMARGFQWKVTKKDVMNFFAGVKILNGENGINIIKNIAMEAYVEFASKADRSKALALCNKKFDSRTIHGLLSI